MIDEDLYSLLCLFMTATANDIPYPHLDYSLDIKKSKSVKYHYIMCRKKASWYVILKRNICACDALGLAEKSLRSLHDGPFKASKSVN